MKTKPSIFVTNFNPRFTGVSATTAAVFTVHKSKLEVALVGKPLNGCPAPINKRMAISLSKINQTYLGEELAKMKTRKELIESVL